MDLVYIFINKKMAEYFYKEQDILSKVRQNLKTDYKNFPKRFKSKTIELKIHK